MNARLLRPLATGMLAALLAACQAVGPDYHLPENSAYARAQRTPMALDSHGSPSTDPTREAVAGRWWALYDDPTLNALVEQALQSNTELRVAAARLKQAEARYEQARAAGGWSEDVQATAGRGRVSAQSLLQPEPIAPFNLAEGGVSVSYQFDLFGKIQRGAEAARANTEATMAAKDLARISVAASVVGAYSEICHSNHELRVARHSLVLQQRSRDIAQRLLDAGRGTAVDVARASAQVAALQAAVPPLAAQRAAAGYELAALLGKQPDQVPAEAMQCGEAPDLRQPIPVGDGAALLRRRPDVRQAERKLAGATAEVGVATAALYPDIHFGASFGYNGLLEDFGKLVTEQWTLAPLISWSLPGKAAHARIRAAEAGTDVALAEFDHVVLEALRETQTVLDRYAEDQRRVDALRESRNQARAAAEDQRRLYQAGRQPYLSSLDAERTLSSAESSLADAQAQVSRDQIRLFLALGGGWQDSARTSEKE